jgi:ABC-type sulfate/molybdate transport systems ATPase subunit
MHMRDCLGQVMRSLDIPVLLVTHDLAEATALAYKMIVCIEGRIHQQGTSEEIISNPSSKAIQQLICVEMEIGVFPTL